MECVRTHGVDISRFMLGTVQLGLNYGMANTTGKPSEEKAREILNAAYESGVTVLDTAAAYGTSEEVVGNYLKANNHNMLAISKFKLKTEEPVAELKGQIETSRRLLGKVDGYMFHDADQMRRHHETVRGILEDMKATDKMAFLGSSVYTADDVEDFLEMCPWLDMIQIPMNVLDTRIVQRGLLEELEKRGVAVVVRSVFLQGMLCMDKVPERFDFMQPSVDAIGEVARAAGMTLPQMAVAYIRDLPGVTSLVLGCETPEQVRQNAEMINVRKLTATEIADITEISRKTPIEHCMEVIMSRKSNDDKK